jgi:hypothetical protein
MFTFRAGLDFPFTSTNITTEKDYYKIKSGIVGTFITPIYAPTLLSSWSGFDIIPRQENITIATIKPGVSGYFYLDGSNWIPSSTSPVYQGIATVRSGLPYWTNESIQFQVKLSGDAIFRELALGYNVPVDIFSYLVNFRIPAIFSQSFEYAITGKTDSTGKITLPESFNNITNPLLKSLGTNRVVIPHTIAGRILTTSAISQPVLLSFNFIPHVTVVNTDLPFQISALPEVLLKVKQETNIKKPFREDHLEIASTQEIVETLDYAADQEIEVAVIAKTNIEAMAIARILISKIQSVNKISSPGDGLEYSLYVTGGIKEKPVISELSNSVMVGFSLKIFNYSVTSKSIKSYIP